ncbi:hypothetical protein BY996DRAFT_6453228 [Phakopsora pachyrhizi]|nr:hypothetical protein BY996DRAFT_6453228 [Phakopsora pachyrhizi]
MPRWDWTEGDEATKERRVVVIVDAKLSGSEAFEGHKTLLDSTGSSNLRNFYYHT